MTKIYNLTKQEALEEMKKGNKVAHYYFDEDEYLYIKDRNMYTEDGCRFEEGFEIRSGEVWEKGWTIRGK